MLRASILDHEKEAARVVRVPSFVVIGGGEDGSRMVRQLRRACAAGRLVTGSIVVVDRDRSCAAFAQGAPVVPAVAEWGDWLSAHLGSWDPDGHVVPYHWAPHLLEDWLAAEVRKAGGRADRGTAPAPRGLPFERTTAAGDRALSYASWPCPPLCIEPALCPHTRGVRDWSLAADLAGTSPEDAIVFRCLHLVYGVGTIPVREIQAARDRVVAAMAIERTQRVYTVSTSSHCHALAATLHVIVPTL
jgi:hypothetical protein